VIVRLEFSVASNSATNGIVKNLVCSFSNGTGAPFSLQLGNKKVYGLDPLGSINSDRNFSQCFIIKPVNQICIFKESCKSSGNSSPSVSRTLGNIATKSVLSLLTLSIVKSSPVIIVVALELPTLPIATELEPTLPSHRFISRNWCVASANRRITDRKIFPNHTKCSCNHLVGLNGHLHGVDRHARKTPKLSDIRKSVLYVKCFGVTPTLRV
jgi:hypothetical protein